MSQDASIGGATSSSQMTLQQEFTEWRDRCEELKNKDPKKFFRIVARYVANELNDGNRDDFIKLEKQPTASNYILYMIILNYLLYRIIP